MINELRDKYKQELDSVIKEMDVVATKIQELDKYGVDLTAKANFLTGKIEACDEILEEQQLEGESNV